MPTWNPRFETGHPQIDAEHQEFFRKLDTLRAAIDAGEGRARIVDLIVILQEYTLGHFSREEAHMRQVACPGLSHNCKAHEEFASRLEAWLQLLTMGNEPISLLSDIHQQTVSWMESHILGVDCQLRGCRLLNPAPPITPA